MNTTRRLLLSCGYRRGRSCTYSPGAPAAELLYKLGNSTPLHHPFNTRLMEAADNIKKDSNGRMEMQIFPTANLEATTTSCRRRRAAQSSSASRPVDPLSTILPPTAVNAMGFVFANYDQVWAAMDGELGTWVRKLIISKTNLTPMEKMWDLGFLLDHN